MGPILRRKLFARWLTFSTVAALVALAGCGGDDNTPSTSRREPAPTSPSTTAASDPTTSTVAAPEPGDPSAANVTLREWAVGLDSPIAFAARPDSTLRYVAEQYRGVRIVAADGTVGDLVLDLADSITTGNEQGVLGLAFAPDGSKLYVNFTDTEGHTHVAEYAMDGDNPDVDSARDVIVIEQPFANHNGGDIQFGPDGYLYIALGDGGAGGDPLGSGQDTNSLLGKILRIDPNAAGDAAYTVPSDNPFVAGGGAGEVWAYGLRNPWRFSFDRANGDIWIGDVGQNEYEEISYGPVGEGGRNYGWNEREGLHDYDGGSAPAGSIDPVVELSHSDGNCSITGGFVYRGQAIPDLVGAYVFGDYCKGDLVAIDLRNDATLVELGVNAAELASFGEDNDGELYLLSRQGTIYQLAAG